MPSINAARLNRRLQELGRFGETPQGMERLAFSPADIASRAYVLELLRQAGMTARIDAAGNLIGRRPRFGRRPARHRPGFPHRHRAVGRQV